MLVGVIQFFRLKVSNIIVFRVIFNLIFVVGVGVIVWGMYLNFWSAKIQIIKQTEKEKGMFEYNAAGANAYRVYKYDNILRYINEMIWFRLCVQANIIISIISNIFKQNDPQAAPSLPQVNIHLRVLSEQSRNFDRVIDEEYDDCCICLDKFVDGKKVNKLECNHLIHTGCLAEWIKKKTICPLCR